MAPELERLSAAFREYLYVKGRNPSTLESYSRSVKLLGSFLQRAGDWRSVREVSVEDLRAFTIHLLDRFAETSVYGHAVGVRQFFAFLEASGVIDDSPAGNLAPPPLRPRPVRILPESDLKALLQACSGDRVFDRRDMALFRVLMATGARPDEVLGIRIDPQGTATGDLDLIEATVVFRSADDYRRKCPLDPRTVNCLKRYLRLRSVHGKGHLPNLWLTSWGGLTRAGLNGILRRRRAIARLPNIKLHQIRSTFAGRWMAGGGNQGDLMRILGIADRRTVDRYSEGVSSETAIGNARDMFDLHNVQNGLAPCRCD